jgi:tetratricopeptide (TPR) repeat protein
VYLIIHPGRALQPAKYTVAAVTLISLLHWGAWIGVNAAADRHLRRMRLLDNPRYLSLSAQLFYDEALANYFFDNGRYADARIYYERFIKIDSHNPRIIANISDVYRKIGEKDKYFETLKLAVELNSRDPGVYSNLGVEYAGRGDTARAIEFNEKAISLDPKQQKAHANLGILYAAKKDYVTAMKHFRTAIELGMQEPVVYRYAAELSSFMGDYQTALTYFDRYLERNPADQKMTEKRERVRTIVNGGVAVPPAKR